MTVYCGDAKSERLLRDAGAEEADVLFAVSGDDSLHIWVASVAKRGLGVPTVIVKVDERESAERARSAGADVVVCFDELVFERLIEAVTSPARAQEGQVYEAAKLRINLYTLRAITFKERGEL